MTMSQETPQPRNFLRSAGAILAGFVTIFVLSLVTDQIFHMLGVYPSWGQPMLDNRLNALALAYRCVYAIVGSFIAARLASHSPMRHALILGTVGFAVSVLGAIAMREFSPLWFLIALPLTALPCAWIGGVLARSRRHIERASC